MNRRELLTKGREEKKRGHKQQRRQPVQCLVECEQLVAARGDPGNPSTGSIGGFRNIHWTG